MFRIVFKLDFYQYVSQKCTYFSHQSLVISFSPFLHNKYEIQHEAEETDNELIVKILTIKNMKEVFMHLDKFFIVEKCDISIESVYLVQ